MTSHYLGRLETRLLRVGMYQASKSSKPNSFTQPPSNISSPPFPLRILGKRAITTRSSSLAAMDTVLSNSAISPRKYRAYAQAVSMLEHHEMPKPTVAESFRTTRLETGLTCYQYILVG
jgi:hypothetical protein